MSRDRARLDAVFALSLEGSAQLRRRPAFWRQQREQLPLRGHKPPRGDQTSQRAVCGWQRRQDRYGTTVIGDLEPLSAFDAPEVLAQVLSKLAHADLPSIHVAHGSTTYP